MDDDQGDLFGSRYPDRPGHVRGSDTSKAAADSIGDALLATLRRSIFTLIDNRGHHGATCDEVENQLDLRHQTASARIRELVLAGAIYDTGRRRLTRSQRKARIYCTWRFPNEHDEAADPHCDAGGRRMVERLPRARRHHEGRQADRQHPVRGGS